MNKNQHFCKKICSIIRKYNKISRDYTSYAELVKDVQTISKTGIGLSIDNEDSG